MSNPAPMLDRARDYTGCRLLVHPVAPSPAPIVLLKLRSVNNVEIGVPQDRLTFQTPPANPLFVALDSSVVMPVFLVREFTYETSRIPPPPVSHMTASEYVQSRVLRIGFQTIVDRKECLPITSFRYLLAAQFVARVFELTCLAEIDEEVERARSPMRTRQYASPTHDLLRITEEAKVDPETGFYLLERPC